MASVVDRVIDLMVAHSLDQATSSTSGHACCTIIHHRHHTKDALRLKRQLHNTNKLKDLGSITNFVGMRITRNRPNRKLWICQDAYIEKMAHQFH